MHSLLCAAIRCICLAKYNLHLSCHSSHRDTLADPLHHLLQRVASHIIISGLYCHLKTPITISVKPSNGPNPPHLNPQLALHHRPKLTPRVPTNPRQQRQTNPPPRLSQWETPAQPFSQNPIPITTISASENKLTSISAEEISNAESHHTV